MMKCLKHSSTFHVGNRIISVSMKKGKRKIFKKKKKQMKFTIDKKVFSKEMKESKIILYLAYLMFGLSIVHDAIRNKIHIFDVAGLLFLGFYGIAYLFTVIISIKTIKK